jgi:hypothetical protein
VLVLVLECVFGRPGDRTRKVRVVGEVGFALVVGWGWIQGPGHGDALVSFAVGWLVVGQIRCRCRGEGELELLILIERPGCCGNGSIAAAIGP